ncbi:MAG: hypothetical protein WBF03_16860 [Xanthobacteraceae bacterium]
MREVDAVLVSGGAGAGRAGLAWIAARLQECAVAERRVLQRADAVIDYDRAARIEHAIDRGSADLDHRQRGGVRGCRRAERGSGGNENDRTGFHVALPAGVRPRNGSLRPRRLQGKVRQAAGIAAPRALPCFFLLC